MLIENDPDVLFECDKCGSTISPNSTLLVDHGQHFCSLACYKKKRALDFAREVFNVKSSLVPPD